MPTDEGLVTRPYRSLLPPPSMALLWYLPRGEALRCCRGDPRCGPVRPGAGRAVACGRVRIRKERCPRAEGMDEAVLEAQGGRESARHPREALGGQGGRSLIDDEKEARPRHRAKRTASIELPPQLCEVCSPLLITEQVNTESKLLFPRPLLQILHCTLIAPAAQAALLQLPGVTGPSDAERRDPTPSRRRRGPRRAAAGPALDLRVGGNSGPVGTCTHRPERSEGDCPHSESLFGFPN